MIPLTKPIITNEEIKAVSRVLKSGHVAQGQEVEKLEKYFAKLCGTKYAVAIVNGTAALHTALAIAGIISGDEVITTPFTFVASTNSILMVDAKPIFVDIDAETYNIDPIKISSKITPKTKAILAVNLFGQPADYDEINFIAKKHKLLVIEDAAQSVGAKYKNKVSGNLGDIGCFSLYATKNIMSAEGGILTTNRKDFYEKALMFRNHGQKINSRYEYVSLGYNYRMTDILATIALVQLKRLKQITKKRQQIATIYNKNLSKNPNIVVPKISARRSHVYHQYTLRVKQNKRNKLAQYLQNKGINTGVYYPRSLAELPYLKNKVRCPVAEIAAQEVLSIPVHPLLNPKDIKHIINSLNAYE